MATVTFIVTVTDSVTEKSVSATSSFEVASASTLTSFWKLFKRKAD